MPVAVYSIALRPRPHVPVRLRACGRLVVGLLLVVAVLRVVAHGRGGYPLFSAAERGQLRMTRCAGRGKLGAREGEVPMTQIAVERVDAKRVAVPTQVPGSTFFALMAGLWGSFVTLLAVSPDDARRSLRLAHGPPDRLGDPHVDLHAPVDTSPISSTRRPGTHWLRMLPCARPHRAPAHHVRRALRRAARGEGE